MLRQIRSYHPAPRQGQISAAGLVSKFKQTRQSAAHNLTLERLMDAGLHLGHSTQVWHKNMLPYIYGRRAGVHIVNLEHTMTHLRRAVNVVRAVTANGGNVLFVGNRPFLLDVLVRAATRSSQFYVHGKWLQGSLTNHEQTLRSATIGNNFLQPDLVAVLDMNECMDCLKEVNSVAIPSIGLCDTDCDPLQVTYCIPGNDDSLASVELVASVLAEAALEGSQQSATSMLSKKKNR